jgi:AraC-like DNA-binding protein/mannose-6-phosphate isomerase-like protein (cupin superfamily)
MRSSTYNAQKTMRNPHLPGASLSFSPLALDSRFPLNIVLDGRRGDQAITQLHIHDAIEVGYCLEGSGTFYVGSKILPFHQADVTIITDREFHRCRSSPGTSSRWAWFFFNPQNLLVPHATSSLTWEPERFCGPHFQNVIADGTNPPISTLIRQIVTEARRADGYTRTNLRSLFVLLLNELHRQFPKPSQKAKAGPSAREFARISPALELIASRFHNQLTIPALAKVCGMSLRNFQLQFARLAGSTPQRHILNSRIQAATALLADDARSIADIAFSCGFNTLSSFNRAFKTTHGLSPRDFRRRKTRTSFGASRTAVLHMPAHNFFA